MTVLFNKETFETGSSPFTFDSYVTDASGSLTLDTTSKVVGANSMKVVRTSAGQSYLVKDLTANYTELYIQFKVFIPTAFAWGTGSYLGLINTFDLAEVDALYLNLEDYGTLRLTFGGGSGYIDTGINISKNAVHKIEIRLKISATVGVVSVWVDNNTSGSPDYTSGNINTGTIDMRYVWSAEGYSDGSHGDYYIDDFIIADAFIGAGAGANYTKSLTEAVALVETQTRRPGKKINEVVTAVEVVSKRPTKLFAETATIVEVVAKRTGKPLAVEAIALVDTGLRLPGKYLPESVTLVEVVRKAMTRGLVEVATLVEVITKTLPAKLYTEVVTLVDTVTKKPTKYLPETVTLVDTIARAMTRSFTEVVTLVASVSSVSARNFTETVTATDGIIKSTAKSIIESLPLVETLANLKVYLRTFSEQLTLVDTLASVKIYARVFTETVSILDTIANISTRGIHLIESFSLTSYIKAFLNGLDAMYHRKYTDEPGAYTAKYGDNSGTYTPKYNDEDGIYNPKYHDAP